MESRAHVDALTLAAVSDDLRSSLMGARVDDVIQPTPRSIALQVYGGGHNRWLLASAHPSVARIHLVDRKPRKLTAEPPAFVMLLRKHVEGTRLVDVRQPHWERVIEVGFRHTSSTAPVWLVVEIMGRLSNIILRDDAGIILGALHHVGADVNRYRIIAPNVPYRTPPPQTRTLTGETVPRLDAALVTAAELKMAAAEMLTTPPDGSAARAKARPATVVALLTAHLLGFSRELATEVTYRALGTTGIALADDLPWDAIAGEARALAALMTTRDWQPTLVYLAQVTGMPDTDPLAYAVYPPRRFLDALLRTAVGADVMLATYYGDAEWRMAVESAKSDLRRILETQYERCTRKAVALAGELAGLEQAALLRIEADTLLAMQTEVSPHASSFTSPNLFAEGDGAADAQLVIALDPRLSAVDNATRKYERYHKLQRAGQQIPPQIAANGLELARIDQLRTDLALAETPAEILAVRAEVAEAGYIRGARGTGGLGGSATKSARKSPNKSGKGGRSGKVGKPGRNKAPDAGAPLRRLSSDGMALLVGKNSRQNEEVTFRHAAANDIWLHARGVPGAHVIVKSGGRPVPESTLREAAALAAYYSQSRAAGTVPVDHTEQRYVRHMKGGGPGMVVYERERTLYVTPADIGA